MNKKEIKKLHENFWKGELKNPMLGVFVPNKDESFPSIDIDIPNEQFFRKVRSHIDFFRSTPDQRCPCAWVNFGPVFLGALAGAEMSWDNDTSWAENKCSDMNKISKPVFRPNSHWWKKYSAKFAALKKNLPENTFLGITDFIGPFDIMAALAGNETLCMEIMMNPEKVLELSKTSTEFFIDTYTEHWNMLDEHDGVTDVFGLYCPGKGLRWSEDFIALIGPDLYREFVLPEDKKIAQSFDTCYMHVHSSAIKCLEHILSIDELSGIEISNDPNGPALEEILEWAQEAYAKNKSVMLSNWQKKLSEKDVNLILSKIDHSRSIVTLEAESMDEAKHWKTMFQN